MALGGKKVGVVNSKQQAKYLGFSINFKMLQKEKDNMVLQVVKGN